MFDPQKPKGLAFSLEQTLQVFLLTLGPDICLQKLWLFFKQTFSSFCSLFLVARNKYVLFYQSFC